LRLRFQLYDSQGGGSGGQSTAPSNNSISNCANSFSGTTAAGQLSANAQASQGAVAGFGSVSSSEAAAAKLADGTLHASASSYFLGGGGTAGFSDTLTFTVKGAGLNTVTTIPFTFSIDGKQSITGTPAGDPLAGLSQNAALGFAPGGVPCLCTHSNILGWARTSSSVDNTENGSGSLASFNILTDTTNRFLATGTLFVTGPTDVIGLAAQLQVFAEGAEDTNHNFLSETNDFSNTATLSLQLPNGTGFTSASQVFLTTSETPLPAALPLFGSGLGLLGFGGWWRTRRRLAA
jgi:hypothetical protein